MDHGVYLFVICT